MSHFVRCDRCSIESAVMGTVTMPPGWLKVFSADLCERCCEVVRDFIRFKPSDAEALPTEPNPVETQPAPEPSKDGDKLFETTPQVSADSPLSAIAHASNGERVPVATDGDPEGKTQPTSAEFNPATESNAEERARTRHIRKKKGEKDGLPSAADLDVVTADPRYSTTPPAPKSENPPTPGVQP